MIGIDIVPPVPDAAMLRGEPQRRCYDTKITFLRQKSGFMRREKRDFSTFTHCHDMEPSYEEMKRLMLRHVPMHPIPPDLIISPVSRRELTRDEYMRRFSYSSYRLNTDDYD